MIRQINARYPIHQKVMRALLKKYADMELPEPNWELGWVYLGEPFHWQWWCRENKKVSLLIKPGLGAFLFLESEPDPNLPAPLPVQINKE